MLRSLGYQRFTRPSEPETVIAIRVLFHRLVLLGETELILSWSLILTV